MPKKTFVVIQQYSRAEPIVVFREVNGTKLKAKFVDEIDELEDKWCATFEMPVADRYKTKIEKLFFKKNTPDDDETSLSLETRDDILKTTKCHNSLYYGEGSFNMKTYDLT